MSLIAILGLVVVAIVVLTLAASLQLKGTAKIAFPYLPAKALFSAAERSFLRILDQAVGDEYRVFGKVRVADIALVKPGLGNAARTGALNRIAYKHFDYVICRASDVTIVCAVELNDKSHASKKALARDNLVASVCQAIELPLLVIQAKQSYSPENVRTQFLAAVSPLKGITAESGAKSATNVT